MFVVVDIYRIDNCIGNRPHCRLIRKYCRCHYVVLCSSLKKMLCSNGNPVRNQVFFLSALFRIVLSKVATLIWFDLGSIQISCILKALFIAHTVLSKTFSIFENNLLWKEASFLCFPIDKQLQFSLSLSLNDFCERSNKETYFSQKNTAFSWIRYTFSRVSTRRRKEFIKENTISSR